MGFLIRTWQKIWLLLGDLGRIRLSRVLGRFFSFLVLLKLGCWPFVGFVLIISHFLFRPWISFWLWARVSLFLVPGWLGIPIFISAVICRVIIWLGRYLGGHYSGVESNKSSPYECGFEGIRSAWIPFSLHFFHFAILFVIWDVEVVLLIPLMKLIRGGLTREVVWRTWAFLIILWGGLVYEWLEGRLRWTESED